MGAATGIRPSPFSQQHSIISEYMSRTMATTLLIIPVRKKKYYSCRPAAALPDFGK
jgi:hypothetical protein